MLNPGHDEFARERRLRALLSHLPSRMQRAVTWLRVPRRFWLRIPVGLLLMAGSLLFILPVFGLWMLPLGLLLLAEDVVVLRRLSGRVLAAMEARWPRLFPHQGLLAGGHPAP